MVDAIIEEPGNKCSGWSQARIASADGDILKLEFIYDTKSVDKNYDRWSVEIAEFETKTKELWEWKKTLVNGSTVDAHDKTVWNKATIFEIKEQTFGPERIVKMGFVGFRIYQEGGTKNDERGAFEGWSHRFDEWISVFSPKI